jgi:DNA-binding CsgD family transcriptional regulator
MNGWLETLAPLLSRDLGHQVVACVVNVNAFELHAVSDPERLVDWASFAVRTKARSRHLSMRQDFLEEVGRPSLITGASVFKLLFQPRRPSTLVSQCGRAFDASAMISKIAPGWADFGCIRADAGGLALTSYLALRPGQSLPTKDRGLLRLQRHLAGAFAKRVRPAWKRSAVVFDASGRVVHSDVKRAPPHLRELRSLVARELDQRSEPDEQAELVWDELWESGWTVARVDDADGRRYLTLRRAPADQPTLTTSERAVLALAREGRSIKWIAAELGISSAGASTQLQSGLRKLGLEHRLELSRLR